MRNRKRVGWHKYINGVTISTLVTVLFIIIPLYWLVATSFKNPNSIGTSPPSLGPTPFSTQNYHDAFVNYDFGIYFKTSVIVTLSTTALVLILGTMAGYALGRLPMRGKFTTMVTLLIISVFPAVAVLAPLYLLMRNLGWLNSYQALILPYTAFNLPFAIWILRNYMLGIFCFTACWTEFLMALTFNSANNYRTIPVGIAEFGGNFQVPYGTIFAASVVAVVPIGVLVFIFRRFVISGLTSGAVKG